MEMSASQSDSQTKNFKAANGVWSVHVIYTGIDAEHCNSNAFAESVAFIRENKLELHLKESEVGFFWALLRRESLGTEVLDAASYGDHS